MVLSPSARYSTSVGNRAHQQLAWLFVQSAQSAKVSVLKGTARGCRPRNAQSKCAAPALLPSVARSCI